MNTAKKHVTSFARVSAISLLVIALVLVLFCCVFDAENIAYSVSPRGYIEQVKNLSKDWYMDGDYLNLSELKEIVASWHNNPRYSFDGIDPVVIAVVDTGIIEDHEIFTGKYDKNGNPTSTDGVGKYDVLFRDESGNAYKLCTANGIVSSDFKDVSSNYHGTHVAGIIAALIHELDLEQYIKILPVRAGKASGFSVSAIALGINKAIEYGADIVNMSLTSDNPNEPDKWSTIGTAAQAEKAVLVAAAGNKGANATYYPAANPNVIGVMNYTKSSSGKVLAGNSNYGSMYDVCAPGVDFYSADGADTEGYKALSGTSMATPVVSFGAALRLLKNRAYCNANPSETEMSATQLANEVRGAVEKDSVTKNVYNEKYDAFDMCALVSGDSSVQIVLADGSQGTCLQQKNNVLPISLQLKSTEASMDFDQGKIAWYLINDDGSLGAKIGEGINIAFTPENKVYSARITAVFTYTVADKQYTVMADCITVKVDHIEFSPDIVRDLDLAATDADGNVISYDKICTGVEYEFSLDGVDLSSISETARIYWYVNGKLEGEGKTFKYTFDSTEKTVVTARVNDQFCKAFEITFGKDAKESGPFKALEIFSIVAGVCIFIVIMTIAVTLVVKKKKKNNP